MGSHWSDIKIDQSDHRYHLSGSSSNALPNRPLDSFWTAHSHPDGFWAAQSNPDGFGTVNRCPQGVRPCLIQQFDISRPAGLLLDSPEPPALLLDSGGTAQKKTGHLWGSPGPQNHPDTFETANLLYCGYPVI